MLRTAISVVFISLSTSAMSQDAFQMTGEWTADVEAARFPKGGEAEPHVVTIAPAIEEPDMVTFEYTATIGPQDGGMFSGTKKTERGEEEIIGVVHFDNESIHIVDSDGTIDCAVQSPNELNCYYSEVNAANSVVTREKWTRN